jgi:hypothetical protein
VHMTRSAQEVAAHPIDPDAMHASDDVARELGFDRGELLTNVRMLLFVEGLSDEVVLKVLYGPDLRRAGALVVPIHGVMKLRALPRPRRCSGSRRPRSPFWSTETTPGVSPDLRMTRSIWLASFVPKAITSSQRLPVSSMLRGGNASRSSPTGSDPQTYLTFLTSKSFKSATHSSRAMTRRARKATRSVIGKIGTPTSTTSNSEVTTWLRRSSDP